MKGMRLTAVYVGLLSMGLWGCEEPIENTREPNQYTPPQADWSTFETKPFEGGTNTSHDPDGVGWLTPESWEAAAWDGTVYDPTQMTQAEFANCLCPSVDQVRGIREVFYEHQPFADNNNPTKAELDEWHRIAINHVRALVGYTSEDRQVQPDYCLFARALWGDERKYTTMWDKKGVWRTEGSMLVLSRKKYGKNEKEKDSAREFRRGIVALSDASLELRHEGALTKCKKKSEAPPKK